MGGIAGLRRFLERVYGLTEHTSDTEPEAMTRLLHKTIMKVSADIGEWKFNTAISAMMIYVNAAEKQGLTTAAYETFLRLLAPFAPHLTEEIWHELGHTESIHLAEYPIADSALAADREVEIGVQINGKLRGTITLSPNATEAEARAAVLENADISARLAGAEIKKFIFVPGRIVSIITT